MDFATFSGRFASSIAAAATPIERYELIATHLGEYFGVKGDEVSLFSFDPSRDTLVFIWPRSLKTVGSIPLNAHKCMVSKTAVEQQARLDNAFATTPHLHMFEHFLSDKVKRIPIQKIMSAPVLGSGGLKGVVQVARKGPDRQSAGADFTDGNLHDLCDFAAMLGDYL
jgi:GAF domain-containing protein